jgi:hypothetical protein
VCVDQDWRCDTATVAPAATVLHALREERLLGTLRQGLALGGPPPAPLPGQRARALGNRAFGATLTCVYYAACADAAVLDAVAIADPPADGVLVVVTIAGVPTHDARELAEERCVDLRPLGGWAALNDDDGSDAIVGEARLERVTRLINAAYEDNSRTGHMTCSTRESRANSAVCWTCSYRTSFWPRGAWRKPFDVLADLPTEPETESGDPGSPDRRHSAWSGWAN